MSKGWIKKAIPEDRKGVFSEKAAAAGKSTSRYATEKEHAPGMLGREARLAKTLTGMSHKPSERRYGRRD